MQQTNAIKLKSMPILMSKQVQLKHFCNEMVFDFYNQNVYDKIEKEIVLVFNSTTNVL